MDKKEEIRKYYLQIFGFKKGSIDPDDFEFFKSEVTALALNKNVSFTEALDAIYGMLTYEFANNNVKGTFEKTTRALANFDLFRTMVEGEKYDKQVSKSNNWFN